VTDGGKTDLSAEETHLQVNILLLVQSKTFYGENKCTEKRVCYFSI
jgi:hypothetical protein